MKKCSGFLGILLVAMAVGSILFPASALASTVRVERAEPGLSGLDFASIPSLGQLTVGQKTYLLERVENGFIARDVDSQRGAVISDQELAGLRLMAPNRSSDENRYTIQGAQLFGGRETLTVIVDEANEYSVSARITAGATTIPVSYELHSESSPRSPEWNRSGGGLSHASEEIILVLVIGAAAISALGCTLAALLTNCASDCADACGECGGSLLSSSEGLCGTCTCQCQQSGFSQEIPNCVGCAAY